MYYNTTNPTNWNTFINTYQRPAIIIAPIFIISIDETKCPVGFPGNSYAEVYGYGILFTVLAVLNYQSFQLYIPHINTNINNSNKYIYIRTLGDGVLGLNELIPRYWKRISADIILSKS